MRKLLAPLVTGLASAWLLLWAYFTAPVGNNLLSMFDVLGILIWILNALLGLLLAFVTLDLIAPMARASECSLERSADGH